jgi:hypothetical protein
MAKVRFRGGARVGWLNASWPFANVSASATKLTLSCLGTYQFSSDQVVALEPYGSIPVLARGIRIRHNRPDYPENIIFWCLGNRQGMLDAISQAGFRATGHVLLSRTSGFAFRWSFIISFVIVWNLLMLLDGSFGGHSVPASPGPVAVLALLLVAMTATAVRASPWLQKRVLREGHQVGEVKSFLIFLQFLTGFMSLAFSVAWLGAGR